mmetsp:Transcript_2385/g.6009  ORF Transcript_2385/g.6009 Transcript_2385/m.6009 type:complete len:386 (+) Transcript_2385:287-1444(+)
MSPNPTTSNTNTKRIGQPRPNQPLPFPSLQLPLQAPPLPAARSPTIPDHSHTHACSTSPCPYSPMPLRSCLRLWLRSRWRCSRGWRSCWGCGLWWRPLRSRRRPGVPTGRWHAIARWCTVARRGRAAWVARGRPIPGRRSTIGWRVVPGRRPATIKTGWRGAPRHGRPARRRPARPLAVMPLRPPRACGLGSRVGRALARLAWRGDARAHVVSRHGGVQVEEIARGWRPSAGRPRAPHPHRDLRRQHGRPARRRRLHGVVLSGLGAGRCLRLAPRQPQPLPLDDQLPKQLLGRLLRGAARSVCDERARLGVHLFDAHDLAKRVKVVAQILLADVGGHTAHEKSGYGHVLRGLEAGHVAHAPQHLVGHRVVDAIVAVLDVLVRQLA